MNCHFLRVSHFCKALLLVLYLFYEKKSFLCLFIVKYLFIYMINQKMYDFFFNVLMLFRKYRGIKNGKRSVSRQGVYMRLFLAICCKTKN